MWAYVTLVACVRAQAGKDRTGVVAMLVLSCAGASEEQIIADYIR